MPIKANQPGCCACGEECPGGASLCVTVTGCPGQAGSSITVTDADGAVVGTSSAGNATTPVCFAIAAPFKNPYTVTGSSGSPCQADDSAEITVACGDNAAALTLGLVDGCACSGVVCCPHEAMPTTLNGSNKYGSFTLTGDPDGGYTGCQAVLTQGSDPTTSPTCFARGTVTVHVFWKLLCTGFGATDWGLANWWNLCGGGNWGTYPAADAPCPTGPGDGIATSLMSVWGASCGPFAFTGTFNGNTGPQFMKSLFDSGDTVTITE